MIPKSLIDEYMPKVKGSTIFGEPLEKLSREELMVLLIFMNDLYNKGLGSGMRNMKFPLKE